MAALAPEQRSYRAQRNAWQLRVQELGNHLGQLLCLFGLTLPNYQALPASFSKEPQVPRIPYLVPIEFRFPVIQPGARKPTLPAAGVLMPETAVHKDDFPMPCQNQIGLSREFPLMQTKAKAQAMNQFANRNFRGHARTADLAHVFAPAGGI